MPQLTQEQVKAFKAGFPNAKEREPMSQHTTYHLGGAARLYAVGSSSDQLVHMVQAADALNIPWYVLGGGSNVLVADDGYEGLVIQAANNNIKIDGTAISVESGCITALVARRTVEAGLAGFEWAVGLPGTIGGAIYGNAGCYGGEMKDAIAMVDAYRIRDHKRVSLAVADCTYEYRDSIFKHEKHLILGCDLQLQKATDPEASKAKLNEILGTRKDDQPLGAASAGCIFKNPKVTQKDIEYLTERGYEPHFGHDSNDHISAGWLIEMAGMMGKAIGNVQVSDKHGNFFVSKPGVKAQDIIALISYVKMKVRDDLSIELQEEVQYLI
jgi:UDP-N-acetylmuramate dehydrogenase